MDLLREGPSFTPDRAQGFEGRGCPVDPADHISRGQCSGYLKNRATECPGLSSLQVQGLCLDGGRVQGVVFTAAMRVEECSRAVTCLGGPHSPPRWLRAGRAAGWARPASEGAAGPSSSKTDGGPHTQSSKPQSMVAPALCGPLPRADALLPFFHLPGSPGPASTPDPGKWKPSPAESSSPSHMQTVENFIQLPHSLTQQIFVYCPPALFSALGAQ